MKNKMLKRLSVFALAGVMLAGTTGCLVVDEDSNQDPKDNNTMMQGNCDQYKTSDGMCGSVCNKVDPDCTTVKACGDGTTITCKSLAPDCPDGLVRAAKNSCHGACVDPETCKEPTQCGGIAGIQCATGEKCVDNPDDNCDPDNGGSDCSGVCVVDDGTTKTCGDGSTLSCRAVAPECPSGTEAEVVKGCYSGRCVDPKTCDPVDRACGDGTTASCEIVPPTCPDGQVVEVINECYGECVDAKTCKAVAQTNPCSDNMPILCNRVAPECPDGLVVEEINGCYGDCVDPTTCKLPDTKCGDGTALMCKRLAPECAPGYKPEIVEGCYGRCVHSVTCEPKACGDGSMALCEIEPPTCPDGQVPEIIKNCYGQCVDANTCKPVEDKACGDGSMLLCKQLAPECGPGYKPEIVNNCYGRCVEESTCKYPERCGDGSMLRCLAPEPRCPTGMIAEVKMGCYGECVDAKTCGAPAQCGGIQGTKCAGANETCVDDPRDACDPAKGGTDCVGYCAETKPGACGDGSTLTCRRPAPVCPRGTTAEIVGGCYSDRCVDETTCKAQARACGDGTQVTCRQMQPVCPMGTVAEVVNNCYSGKCLDQYDCKSPTQCGGFVGTLCASNYTCVDDNRDSCDPKNGGADCIGVCVGNP